MSSTDSANPSDSTDSRALAAVTAVVFVAFVGYGLLIPIIPLYAAAHGADELGIGLLVACYALVQFAFAPLAGRLSDRFGRRPVLLVTIAVNVCAYVLLGLAESLWLLFLARALSGIAGSNVAVAQAAVADAASADDRARGFGLVGAAIGTGFVFGPALGGLFSSDAAVAVARDVLPRFEPLITGFSLPCFVTALLAAANFLLAWRFVPESPRAPSRSGPPRLRETSTRAPRSILRRTIAASRLSVRRLIADRIAFDLVCAYAIRTLAYTCMTSMFVVFTADVYGYDATINGYVLAFVGCTVALTQGLVVSPVLDRVDESAALAVAAATQAGCLVALPFSRALAAALPVRGATVLVRVGGPTLSARLLALLLVVGTLAAADAFATVSIKTLLSKRSSSASQGESLGFAESGDALARAFAPILAGYLYAAVGYWAPFVFGGGIALLVLPLVGRIRATAGFEGRSDRSSADHPSAE